MYTVGQVAKFLGISRDALKFYEEKELVKPRKDPENGYRKYDHFDIYDVITTNFYRELDIEIKKIQEIRKSKSVEDIKLLLSEKEEKILEEIEYKNFLLKKIKSAQRDCEKAKKHLGKFSIQEMKPLEVKGEISNYSAYEEYDIIQKNAKKFNKAVTLTELRREISFDKECIKGDRFIIVRKVENSDQTIEGEILAYPRCIYTVVENGRWLNGGKNIDGEVGDSLKRIANEHGYELLGLAYINILLTTYQEGLERVFLEVYTPIK